MAKARADTPIGARSVTAVTGALPLYMATMFLSAVLLFSVQPLIARLALPLLGGSPAVWNTAMVFFQTVLLAGYAYAHLTSRFLAPRPQAVLHLGVLAVAAVALPVGLASGWTPPAAGAPIPWLVALLAVSVGLPFFAVSANAPILQRWFSHTGHKDAANPYFLYGASNLGSILVLLAYPALIEPALRLDAQSAWWTAGYAMLAVLIAGCALMPHRWAATGGESAPPFLREAEELVSWGRRLHWIALAAIPSGLLLGLTSHVSTDVAAAPLLWVLPLVLYLLTFVIVFARRPVLRHGWMVHAQPFLVITLALFYWFKFPVLVFLPFHLLTFFVTAMVCHGELARLRPGAARLTEFYMWMSLGGMLGGAFTALLAPLVFDAVWEYPLALVLACLLRPSLAPGGRAARWLDVLLPAGLAGAIVLWFVTRPPISETLGDGAGGALVLAILAGAAMVLYAFRMRPLRLALGLAAILFATLPVNEASQVIARDRSFFGVYKIKLDPTGAFRMLIHGTTVHGAQHVDDALRRDPPTYYFRDGPVGRLFAGLNDAGRLRRVGVIGLGVGALACYRRPGQSWTFYEIDPVVVEIARDRGWFHYLADCAPEAPVVLGDGRLSLAKSPSGNYDLLVIDAFSSDAIPTHMMTREAFALYREKLSEHGVLFIHVSNRNLKLAPVVANLAADSGLLAWHRFYQVSAEDRRRLLLSSSEWIAIARRAEDLAFIDRDASWRRLESQPQGGLWTDDFSNIFNVIRW